MKAGDKKEDQNSLDKVVKNHTNSESKSIKECI